MLAIVNVNVMLDADIQIIKIVNAEQNKLISQLKNVVKILMEIK